MEAGEAHRSHFRFAKSVRLSTFLLYIVRQSISGNSEDLTEQLIGERVFGRHGCLEGCGRPLELLLRTTSTPAVREHRRRNAMPQKIIRR